MVSFFLFSKQCRCRCLDQQAALVNDAVCSAIPSRIFSVHHNDDESLGVLAVIPYINQGGVY